MTQPYFAMTSPPQDAETHLLAHIMKQQRDLGRISTLTGQPVALISEYDDLAPSVKRVVDYLYDHPQMQCTLDVKGCRLIGGANTKQLNIDIEWLIEQGLVQLVIHDYKRVIFLTTKAEELVDEG